MNKVVRLAVHGRRQDRLQRYRIVVDTREIAQFRRVGALHEIRDEARRSGDEWGAEVADHLREIVISTYRKRIQPKAA